MFIFLTWASLIVNDHLKARFSQKQSIANSYYQLIVGDMASYRDVIYYKSVTMLQRCVCSTRLKSSQVLRLRYALKFKITIILINMGYYLFTLPSTKISFVYH